MSKMTDEQIKKALACCNSPFGEYRCCSCPLCDTDNCKKALRIVCLDLINRQQTEIERLQRLFEQEEKSKNSLTKKCYKDGIKEFAERLNKEAEKVEIDREGDFIEADNKIYDTVANWCKTTSDNISKEMVGEKE